MLYPLKFKPILKMHIWGGERLLGPTRKRPAGMGENEKIGESWEISGVDKSVSVVSNGFLKSNDLQELIEVYMGDLIGEQIYDKYGEEFPILIKFIDAENVLSVQVHPDDEMAMERHGTRGKTEMWYVVDCKPGSFLYVGFKRPVTREEYLGAVKDGTLPGLLMKHEVKKGDCYFIPAGTVHAIGEGILIAEIQETSDITYRIDDWGRLDDKGNPRELHTDLAVDAIDFSYGKDYHRQAKPVPNTVSPLVASPYFNTNSIFVEGSLTRGYESLDSFVIYVCVDGSCEVTSGEHTEKLTALESILIPADLDEVTISGKATILEVFIR